MGTSNAYLGPTGTNPLLPRWAQPPADEPLLEPTEPPQEAPPEQADPAEDNDEEQEAEIGIDQDEDSLTPPDLAPSNAVLEPKPVSHYWNSAKRNMTGFIGGGGGKSLSQAGRSYVGARGGASGAARSSVASRSSTARLAQFLSGVASQGFAATAQALGLSFVVGQSVESILAAVAEAIAPDGALLEDAIARQAIEDVLIQLFERFDLENGSITNLQAMGPTEVREAITLSVIQSIYLKWLQELGEKIERNALNAKEAWRLEREVKQYVQETVTLDLTGLDVLQIDWRGREGQEIVERIYTEAYAFLETEE